MATGDVTPAPAFALTPPWDYAPQQSTMGWGAMRRSALACASVLLLGLSVVVPSRASASTGWALQPLASQYDGGGDSAMESVSCVAANNCMASGFNMGGTIYLTLAERWNGRTWTSQDTPFPADMPPYPSGYENIELRGIKCVSASFCMGTGDYVNDAGARVTLAEVYKGRAWSIVPTVNPGPSTNQLNSVACTTTTNCIAVGFYQNAADVNYPLAERWNGSNWTQITAGSVTGGRLLGIACTTAKACTAVGYIESSSPLAERWNGIGWKRQSVPKPTGAGALKLKGVKCVSGTVCFAVGATGNMEPPAPSTPTGSAVAERWSGGSWHVLAVPRPYGLRSVRPEM